ncbi:MAG: adenine deaminase [Saprospirales bacterium]|nr:MAG: adenine deaminase [Saprospirales bacterium]
MTNSIKGQLIDIHQNRIFPAKIEIANGRIAAIYETEGNYEHYIAPGLVDAHVHIESSMLTPVEFARLAVSHGTVATVSDPHEIANVLGAKGIRYMIENAKASPLKFHFGAPSCVPATTFETAGATIDSKEILEILQWPEITYLAEMMNFPGVLYKDPEVMKKIKAALDMGLPVDGHAPGLRGDDAKKYIESGISTDHECTTYEEALEKIQYGMKIAIREGSAAKNFEALIPLIADYPESIMFCSDDKHPDELIISHIDELIRRGLKKGYPLFDLLRAASLNPKEHYNLNIGMLKVGDPADFITIDHPDSFQVRECWISGKKVAENGVSFLESIPFEKINYFNVSRKKSADFELPAKGSRARVIEAIDGALITESFEVDIQEKGGKIQADTEKDILFISVVNRYSDAPVANALIHGFGIKGGAIASTVAHDCHNIIAVGTSTESISKVVNELIRTKGGICAMNESGAIKILPLPIAGLLAAESAEKVAEAYQKIDQMVKTELGSTLNAPFMTLSFMALLVIPSLKLSDKGLFDGNQFEFTDLFK